MAQRTWTYVYQDAQGKRHEGEMSAPQKDDVYAELRKQGIRAQRVTERVQPVVKRGFRGLRPRDWCLIAAATLALTSLVVYLIASGGAHSRVTEPLRESRSVAAVQQGGAHARRNEPLETPAVEFGKATPRRALPRPRRALVGTARDLDAIFDHPSERLLALFAEPGRSVGPVSLTPEVKEDLVDALETDILILPTDGKDVIALKRIVAGLKEDVLEHIGAGLSIDEVFYRYAERQRMEAEYRAGIIRSLKGRRDFSAVNARLSAMGMAPVGEDEVSNGQETKK